MKSYVMWVAASVFATGSIPLYTIPFSPLQYRVLDLLVSLSVRGDLGALVRSEFIRLITRGVSLPDCLLSIS